MNILIVEENGYWAKSIKELIERWGHEVEKARSGKEALRRFTQNIFDLVLLDIFLPDIKGYELIEQLKTLCPEIGIVTMTGYNTRELETEVRKQGILYYMIKPFETKSLKELLDHISHKYSKKANNEIDLQVRKEVKKNGRISRSNGSGSKGHGRQRR
jgi:DNA-binding NtrC family response regulator